MRKECREATQGVWDLVITENPASRLTGVCKMPAAWYAGPHPGISRGSLVKWPVRAPVELAIGRELERHRKCSDI